MDRLLSSGSRSVTGGNVNFVAERGGSGKWKKRGVSTGLR